MAEVVDDPFFWARLWDDINTVDLGEMVWVGLQKGYAIAFLAPGRDTPAQVTVGHPRWGGEGVLLNFTDTDLPNELMHALAEQEDWSTDVELGIVMAKYNP